MNNQMTHLNWTSYEGLFTYETYRQRIDELLLIDQTTGDNHNEAMLNYTRLNVARMRRLDKTTRLTQDSLATLAAIGRPQVWLTITEAWCGDAAQIIPVVQKMADENPLVEHHLVLRDEHLDLMDAFLTNGTSRSIPITIVIDTERKEVLGHWGPRPAVLQTQLMATKVDLLAASSDEDRKAISDQAKIDTQKWYAKDKTKSIQAEFGALL